jgi:hypothetical protein
MVNHRVALDAAQWNTEAAQGDTAPVQAALNSLGVYKVCIISSNGEGHFYD